MIDPGRCLHTCLLCQIAKALMAGTLFSPRACGCLSTRSMFLVSVWGFAAGWWRWKQTWDPVSPPLAGSAGPAGEGPEGFLCLALSVTESLLSPGGGRACRRPGPPSGCVVGLLCVQGPRAGLLPEGHGPTGL